MTIKWRRSILSVENSQMKVLMLAPYSAGDIIGGGAERHIKCVINSLKIYNNLDIHIISITKGIKNDSVLKYDGITVHQIKAAKLPMTIAGITLYPVKILSAVKEIKPDLIHGQMIGAPYGLATGLLSKKYPTILTVHTLIKQTSKTTKSFLGKIHDVLWRFLEKWELKRIPHIIVVSPHLKDELENDGARNVSVIPNGIDASWFDIPDKSITGRILFVGRVIPSKGIENLILSMKLVIAKGYDVHLHIVGPTDDANHLKYLRELTKELEIPDHVKFLGGLYGDALLKEYAESAIFVLPSIDESNPIVLLEAMASGKTVIATNVGGIPYMVENEKNGILVNYGDIEGLAEKILIFINDKKIRDYIRENAIKVAKKYSWEKVSEETYKVYRHVYEIGKWE